MVGLCVLSRGSFMKFMRGSWVSFLLTLVKPKGRPKKGSNQTTQTRLKHNPHRRIFLTMENGRLWAMNDLESPQSERVDVSAAIKGQLNT